MAPVYKLQNLDVYLNNSDAIKIYLIHMSKGEILYLPL